MTPTEITTPGGDVLLTPDADTSHEAFLDHPDEVTEEEAADGLAVYLAVDDLDDESNGLDQ